MGEIYTFFLLTILTQTFKFIQCESTQNHQLYLTQGVEDFLELNWDYPSDNIPDNIYLTAQDISTHPDTEILYKIQPGSIQRGNHKTNQKFVKTSSFPGNWDEKSLSTPVLQSHCFDFYISSFKNDRILHSGCFGIQPTWMGSFGQLRIANMTIPGTHDSGAFETILPGILKNYVLAQDRNLYQQLVHGIRYFDLRIGRYGGRPDQIWINHDVAQCTPFLPQLKSVLDFVKKSPKEVVILNFHRFPYPPTFLPTYHKELLDVITSTLSGYILPYNKSIHRYGPTLEEIWAGGDKRIIISYNDYQVVRDNSWLWPTVTREWGNIQEKNKLEDYIKEKLSRPILGDPMSVIMAELTPTPEFILKNLDKSLKHLAHIVNVDLGSLLFENDRINNLNVIATDFFTGNDCVNNAIESNREKLRKSLSEKEV